MTSVRPEQAGQASGATNAIRELGGVLGVAVLAAVSAHQGDYATPSTFVSGFQPALIVGAATVALGVVATPLIPRASQPACKFEPAVQVAS